MIEQLRQKYRWTCGLAEVAKWAEQGDQMGGRETGGCCGQVCERFFLKWTKSVIYAWLIPILWGFCRIKKNGWENDPQSWNPCFLGVCSPNQLPKASWLGNLTNTWPDWTGHTGLGHALWCGTLLKYKQLQYQQISCWLPNIQLFSIPLAICACDSQVAKEKTWELFWAPPPHWPSCKVSIRNITFKMLCLSFC